MQEKKILAATPVFISPGKMPIRYVLVKTSKGYLVATEIFDENHPYEHIDFYADLYYQFGSDKRTAFAHAYKTWMNKAVDFQSYIDSNGTYTILDK